MLENVLKNAARCFSLFQCSFIPELKCSCCSKICSNNTENMIELDATRSERDISGLVQDKYQSYKEAHAKEALHKTNFEFLFQSGIKSCIFHCKVKMSIHLESIIKFGDVNWKCVGLISDSWESFFKIKDRWFKDDSELPTDT